MKKKVLITGSNGFIGLNVLKTFLNDEDFDVYAVVHKNISKEIQNLDVKIIKLDVTDENSVSKLKETNEFDIVIHIAGLAKDIGKDEKFKKLNFESVKNMHKLAKEKFVYVSSTDVYGIKDFNCANETTEFHNFPNNPYPKYKIESEKWLEKNSKNHVIIRPAAVWGENDKTLEKRVIEFLETSPFIVHFGKWKGKNRWPLANVSNVSKTILAVCKFDDFNLQAINIIDSKITTIDEYYNQIAKKYFPNKKYKTITLPLWIGKIIGFISTCISNLFNLKEPIYDPTFYALHHVSSNLDFDNKKMLKAIKLLEENLKCKNC